MLLLTIPLGMVADYLFKTLEARDGLTSSQVNCILKDSRGYMWFGTPAGLYRFHQFHAQPAGIKLGQTVIIP